MKKSAKLVFFGTEDFSAKSLETLISNGWNILAVVTKPDFKAGRGQKLTEPKVKAIAKASKIKVLQPDKLTGFEKEIKYLEPTHGVLVAYGKIIPQAVIDAFPGGIINVHPSLLPKYRGPAPIEAAILNGDRETAISLMRLTAGLDEGPVYTQTRVDLSGDENRIELTEKLSALGAKSLSDNLEGIVDGTLIPIAQDDDIATYTHLLKKEDGYTDLNESAEQIERKTRAFLGYPKLKTRIFGHEIVVTKSRVAEDNHDGKLVLGCNPGYLEILELIAPSGRTITGQDFKRGYSKT